MPDVERVWPVIVRRDLDRAFHALRAHPQQTAARPIVRFPILMRENQFRVRVNARPKPEIATLSVCTLAQIVLGLWHSASVTADILPLLIHFDSLAGQIAQVFVHVIGEHFAGIANDAQHGVNAHVEHPRDRIKWSAFAQALPKLKPVSALLSCFILTIESIRIESEIVNKKI